MPKQHLLEIIGILFGAGAIGPVMIRQGCMTIRKWIKSRDRQRHLEGLRRISSIYDELNQIIAADDNIQRVMIVRSSNSGGIPQPGCRIFIRVLHEAYRTLYDSVIHSNMWSERQADQSYISLVRRIAEEGEVRMDSDTLPEDSTLKAIWDASFINHGTMYRLRLSGTEMIYLSIHYRKDTQPSAMARAVLATSVDQLKQLFAE